VDSNRHLISVPKDFSKTPGTRYIKQGPCSGEKFRTSCLIPALEKYDLLIVDLDGTAGYGSSFIDEAFGGLIRREGFNAEDLLRRIKIKSDEEIELIADVKKAFRDARPN